MSHIQSGANSEGPAKFPSSLTYDALLAIMVFLDLQSLKNVALVNSMFCHMARTQLWRHIIMQVDPAEKDLAKSFSRAAAFIRRSDVNNRIESLNAAIEYPYSTLQHPPLSDVQEFMAAVASCPRLHYLAFRLHDDLSPSSTAITNVINNAVLSPQLRTFETDLHRIHEFCTHNPNIHTLILRRPTNPIIAPLSSLSSLHVSLGLEMFHVIGRPVSSVHLDRLWFDPALDLDGWTNILPCLHQSTTPIRSLTISYIPDLTDDPLMVYLSLVAGLESLSYLSLTHAGSAFARHEESRQLVWSVLGGLKELEELKLLGNISTIVRGDFFRSCAPRCKALRRFTVATKGAGMQGITTTVQYQRFWEGGTWMTVRETFERT